jgi:hypothetical protein
LKQLRAHITKEFRDQFETGLVHYLTGDWGYARVELEKANEMMRDKVGTKAKARASCLLFYNCIVLIIYTYHGCEGFTTHRPPLRFLLFPFTTTTTTITTTPPLTLPSSPYPSFLLSGAIVRW